MAAHRDVNKETVSDLAADSSYRTTLRSNTLKRIYEKNARLPPLVAGENLALDDDDNGKPKPENTGSTEEQHRENLRERLTPQSSEWRKTLERILNYDQGYLDRQLEISRRDALYFFIKKQWSVEGENDGDSKRRRGKKKSAKLPSPEQKLVNSKILVERKPPISWKAMSDSNPTKISLILASNVKDKEAIDAVCGHVLRRDSSLYERCILRPLYSLDYLHTLSYLFRRNESSKAFNFFSTLYNWFAQHNSAPNGQMLKSFQSSSAADHHLNNNRFQLEVTRAEISFSKHYLMDEECKLLRLLIVAYERYRKSISTETTHRLDRINEVIAAIVNKMESTHPKTNHDDERELDINLLRRAVDCQRATINTRRKSLIELLKVWDRFVTHKATTKLVSSNCINLTLEEAADVNEESERSEWNRLVDQSTRWEMLIQSKSEVDRDNVKSITYLYDGRLPGEPKFRQIELLYDRAKSDKNKGSHLDLLYTIQVSIGEKNVVQFEPLFIFPDFSNLKWSQSVSVSFPWFPHTQHPQNYSSLSSPYEVNSSALEDYCQQYLPKISIYEKSSRKGAKATTYESRLLWQQTLSDLPRFYQKSANNGKQFATDFECAFKEDDSESRLRIKGSIQLCSFWAALPFNAKSVADSSMAEIIFDQEKRQIRQMVDLKMINQTLHDLRYLDAINLETFAADNSSYSVNADSMRQMQLLDLCLRQKYHIELNNNLLLKEELARKNKTIVKEKERRVNLNLGTFCSDEEIEQNKRFQLMIHRNSDTIQNCQQLRFIPLHVTDVMLENVMLSEKTEMISTETLVKFIEASCDEHKKRIQGNDKKRRKKKRNAESENKVFHDWCLSTSNRDGTNHLLTSTQNYLQTIRQVLDRLKVEQSSQNLNGDSLNMSGFFGHKSRILAIEDIIREESIESLNSAEFSLFWPFANMSRSKLNPSRKDRRKAAITLSEALDREVQVVLSVQHALNVPLRRPHEDEDDEDEGLFSPCASFVEVLYDNQSISTSIADGSQPTWNESFRFKIKLDPRKCITLNLFEVLKSVRSSSLSSEAAMGNFTASKQEAHFQKDETATASELSESNTYMQLEKRFFGQFKIPLLSILLNSKIEGTFSLSTPYFLQSYKSLSTSASNSSKISRLKLLEQDDEKGTQSMTDAKLLAAVNQMQALYSDDTERTLLGSLPDIELSLFLTIDPPIEPTGGFQFSLKNASIESTELVEHCSRWCIQLGAQFHNRHFISLVENVQHKLVLACRYLAPIKPPELSQLIHLDQIVPQKGKGKADETSSKRSKVSMKRLVHREALHLNMIIRFVSLMPTFAGNPPSSGNTDQSWWWRLSKSGTFWLDALQFLSFRIGFQAEHATYLCCMLQYLDRNAYLLYGKSLLEGLTVYVILYPSSSAFPSSKEDSGDEFEPVVINPRTGQQFGVRDCNITIQSIDCIITNDNIYANVQKNAHPNSMQYNLRKSSHWQPLFSSTKEISRFASLAAQNETEFLSIQPELIDYNSSIHHESASHLEYRLESFLRDQLMTWRRQQAATFTPINRYCTQIIRRILPKLETHACLASASGSAYTQQQQVITLEEALLQELDEVNSIHSVVGYPLHVSPIVDFEQIAQLVHSTGVHSLDATSKSTGKMAEFIVSVYVHAYPANVYSIWVYIGALLPKA